jgi:hypothetical protein
VTAVFAKSLHLEAGGDFLCLGDAAIGAGPLNALLNAADWKRVRAPMPGSLARIYADRIALADAELHTHGATAWHPPPWPGAPDHPRLAVALACLNGLARKEAPEHGLARIAFAGASDRHGALEPIALPTLTALKAWLKAHNGPPPLDLLGLGPGLTPSGDDLLCGVLVALHATSRRDVATALYAAIAAAAPTATSPLSCAFLRAAGEGLAFAELHDAITAMLRADPDGITRAITKLARIGHTSGWDALAGAALGLQADA